MSNFHNERQVTTRKPHRCEWCGKIIEAGETATYSSGKNDGYFYDRYAHPACERLIYALEMYDPAYDDGIDPDGWRQNVREAYLGDIKNKLVPEPSFDEMLRVVQQKYVFDK